MHRTITRYINLQNFVSRGESAIIVIKLMMACNDLSLANDALGQWKKEKNFSRKARQMMAMRYFVRLQLAHLHEGLKVIEEVRNDHYLLTLVKRCDSQTQESFQNIEQFLPGGPERNKFEKLVTQIRQNITFHYRQSNKLIKKALSDRASRTDAKISSLTRSNTSYLWDFKVADDIIDSIVVRQVWDIPRDADLRIEADKILDYVHQIFLWFMDFSSEFIWKYCEQ